MLLVFKALGSFRFHRSSGKRTLVYLCNRCDVVCSNYTPYQVYLHRKSLKKYNLNGAHYKLFVNISYSCINELDTESTKKMLTFSQFFVSACDNAIQPLLSSVTRIGAL